MNLRELTAMIEDEVAKIVSEPLKEPQAQKKKVTYKPVLQNEDDIDDYSFYAGNTPEDVREKKKKKNKKLLRFGN